MTIDIDNFKMIVLEHLAEDFDVDLPYAKEHRPDQYLSQLTEASDIVKALIELESMSEADIQEMINKIPDGTRINEVIKQATQK